jgi:hypothetical protein
MIYGSIIVFGTPAMKAVGEMSAIRGIKGVTCKLIMTPLKYCI